MCGVAVKIDGDVGARYPGRDPGLVLGELHAVEQLSSRIELKRLTIHLHRRGGDI